MLWTTITCDGSIDRLESEYPYCTYIRNEDNYGFARGCNRGIEVAYADGVDFVLLLNNDITVPAGFLEPAVQAARNDSGSRIGNRENPIRGSTKCDMARWGAYRFIPRTRHFTREYAA